MKNLLNAVGTGCLASGLGIAVGVLVEGSLGVLLGVFLGAVTGLGIALVIGTFWFKNL